MQKKKRGILERVFNRIRLTIQHLFEKITKRLPLNSTKEIYYIIRRDNHGAGFFSNYLWVLGHIIYAHENHMIPVVDFKHYPTLYSEKGIINGTKNAWNYYFENVSNVSLHAAYKSKNFVLADFNYPSSYCERHCGKYGFPLNDAVDYYYPIIRNNIRIREDIRTQLENDLQSIGISDSTLAVHYRGTDMKRSDNWMHEQTAAENRYIDSAKRLMSSGNYSSIFLATDEEKIINLFKEVFGQDKIITYKAFRDTGKNSLEGIHLTPSDRKNHKYLLGYEVLRDAYTLSKCKSLICGYSNVSNIAIIWNNNKYAVVDLIERKQRSENT